jgi:cell wall-associated NlpC family hydrolase
MVTSAGDAVVESALSLVGTPYRFGGATPEAGFDCSGLVVYVMALQDIGMPRTVQEQYRVGLPVGRTDLRDGDLVFFTTTGPGATHVGIVSNVERREFVHAPNTGSAVRVDRLDAEYWHRNWIGARRVY